MVVGVFDVETDGLNPTKIHCLVIRIGSEVHKYTRYSEMREVLLRDDLILVGHNIILYDVPSLERILGIKVTAPMIDTLGLSWYLYSHRQKHGLESWGDYFGIQKPEIDDWENLTIEEYLHRCTEDVEINSHLWEKITEDLLTLYEGNKTYANALIKYLSHKLKTVALQEHFRWKLDVDQCEENLAYLEGIKEEKIKTLSEAMPMVDKFRKMKVPKKMHKADGSFSAVGQRWKDACEEQGLDWQKEEEIKIKIGQDEPNPDSHVQIKDWLKTLGWEPIEFNSGANGEVPQIYVERGDEKVLCESVLALKDKSPAVEALDELGVIRHRIGILKGFLRDQVDGYLKARIAGFTSTLRMRHKEIVNLPKPSRPYGKLVRGVLVAPDGYELCNADLASLEDRTKQHFIYKYDPEYVETMLHEGFDPHLDLAVFSEVITEGDAEWYKQQKKIAEDGGEIEDHERFEEIGVIRHQYKTTNYAATYGVGFRKLAKTLAIAEYKAKRILDAYWERNWAIITFSESLKVKKALGKDWVQNPINKFWYELRSDKDRFSAVNQSAGDFICYLWIKYILEARPQITGSYHDEVTLCVKKGYRKEVEEILRDSIDEVNRILKLNRDMDIGVGFGDRYADIH